MNKKKIFSVLFLLAAVVLTSLAVSCKPDKPDETTPSLPDYNGEDAVIFGADGYLFGASGLPDFYGENLYGEDELTRRVGALTDIAADLYEKDCKTVFVLVPSKLSVYSDKLPQNVKSKKAAGERRFTQLSSALTASKAEVLDLTAEFEKLKDGAQLYHTASDELNDVGGYYLYSALAKLISEKYGKNVKTRDISEYETETTEDETYPLTREYRNVTGITVANKTVALKQNDILYSDADYRYEATEATYIPEAKRTDDIDYPRYLVLDTGASSACRKFFSEFSAKAVFRRGIVVYEPVVDRAKPEYAVIIINEDGLSSLPINEKVIITTPDVSAAPVINAGAYTDAEHYVMFGVCEKNCKITVKGGAEEVSVRSEDGKFVVEAPIKQEDTSFLSVYCGR